MALTGKEKLYVSQGGGFQGIPLTEVEQFVAATLPMGGVGEAAGPLGPDGKLPTSQLPVGDVNYLGNWNAATNTPTLAAGVGTSGDLYICHEAGSQNLGNGVVAFAPGDWVIYDGTAWDRVEANGATPANPSATVALAAKNGSAATFMRSDAAPALDVAIAPTWTGAHTFTQAITAAAINASGTIKSTAGVEGNTTVTAGIGSNSVQLAGAANGQDTKIQALGVTDASVSIQMEAKGSGLLKMVSPVTMASTLNVTGVTTLNNNVSAKGSVSSSTNGGLASPTNSGINLSVAPNWGMAQFYDSARSANDRSMDILFIGDGLHMRFVNDARNAFLDFLTVTGGQASGVTGITTNSGSGTWAHTGAFSTTGVIDAGAGLRVKEGANAKQGVATLVAGTVTVNNTSVTANSRIFLTGQDNNAKGSMRVSARTPGVSFVITSNEGLDTGVVAYEIFEPGA